MKLRRNSETTRHPKEHLYLQAGDTIKLKQAHCVEGLPSVFVVQSFDVWEDQQWYYAWDDDGDEWVIPQQEMDMLFQKKMPER
jgi:hypothetical protein